MNTTKLIKTLACAMLMPAVLLTASCSKGDDAVTNPEKPANTEAAETAVNKGYALPVTVNVTRQGDGTRATFDGSKLNFSAGDKLFVYGSATAAGSFAGTLDYDTEKGNFCGTIYTQEEWTGTADALFAAASAVDNLTATLLPYNYGSTGFLSIDNKNTTDIAYDDRLTVPFSNAFVASETAKATGVEQLSLEQARSYSDGFALSPENAILNFTISGLEAGAKNVELQIHHGFDYTVTGSVTPNASGVATFAIGVPNGANIKEGSNNLTVGSSKFTLPSSTTFAAGKIYNITRGTGATVDLSTKNADYTAQNGETLTGALASNVKISIADGATVILNGVSINGTNDGDNYQWAGISCEGDATIILSGTNTVKGFHGDHPGIHVPTGKTLIIDGTGSLNASSNGYGAGIGGGWNNPCGNIVIEGGTITANGGGYCAGIGGGTNACGDITISGGTITAQGGENGAGIGVGTSCNGGNITISGGTITAQGGKFSAGIGSGYNNSRCGDITITSGVTCVTATKGEIDPPCSIGKGKDAYYTDSSCGTVTIGGTVYPDGIAESPYTYQP